MNWIQFYGFDKIEVLDEFIYIGPLSKSKFELNVVISLLEFSSSVSYSVTRNGSAIKGYSFENTNFCVCYHRWVNSIQIV